VKTESVSRPRSVSPWAVGVACLNACLKKTRNVARGLTQRYGTETIKRNLWDAEFSGGRWTCLESMPDDCVYAHVERHANGGSILDLGCGPGTTGPELAAESYASYTGVDISEVAVEKARRKAEECHRAHTNRYFQGDIVSYAPNRAHDVILFGDSLYYVPQRLILPMLKRYSQHLTPTGVFVARIYGRRYQRIVEVIENNFDVVEKRLYGVHGDDVFVLAFRV
jgi:SAM-dependent methyltransferase